jgi:hypothetical protein
MTVVLFSLLSAVIVFAIAASVVGREAHRLDAVAPRVVYELNEAVQFVAEQLPEETQARLTLDELAAMLRSHLNWMAERDLLPRDVIDRPQDISVPVIVDDMTFAAHLLAQAESLNVEVLDDVDVVNVADAHMAYLAAIGAVGPRADD